MGADTRWMLSHGLFSSFGIDEGTTLLLKTLAASPWLPEVTSLLDIGSGTGVIAGAIKSRFPAVQVYLQDRDALALHFSALNFTHNKLSYAGLSSDLALHGIKENCDLIVSNIPAKAGTPVIRELISRIPGFLNPGGRAAVVVISALKETAAAAVIGSGQMISLQEHTPRYSVFHFAPKGPLTGRQDMGNDELESYLRDKKTFNEGGVNYTLSTAYNLDEFDTISYSTHSLFSLLKRVSLKGPFGVYHPGQGHAALYLAKRSDKTHGPVSLIGRDILSLRLGAFNLKAAGFEAEIFHLPFPDPDRSPGRSLHFLAVFPQKIPGVGAGEYWPFAEKALETGSWVSFSGPSAQIHHILSGKPRNFSLNDSCKYRGHRSILLQKR
ncbi:MAG: methyltransferase [Spirochaetales bacterium]|nr:methyltransferase [Spirochaetales bacterium]